MAAKGDSPTHAMQSPQLTPRSHTQDLSRMKRIRGAHRTSSKRLIAAVDDCFEAGINLQDFDRVNQLKHALKEKGKTLDEFNENILSVIDEDEIENEVDTADKYKEAIQLTLIKLQNKMSALQSNLSNQATTENYTPDQDNATEADNISRTSSNHESPTPERRYQRTNHLKLPKLDLVKFSGELSQWITFWDAFDSAINSNGNLAPIDKFNYLNSLLEGTAKEAVRGLSLTSANYEEAVAILKKRFGNKQKIINRHMEILLNSKITGDDIKDLRQLYDNVETQIRSLKSLGISPNSYGSILSGVLMNRLPEEIRLIVSREIKDEVWELDNLMVLLCSELDARERATESSSSRSPSRTIRDSTSKSYAPGFKKYQTTASALFTSQEKIGCTYCRESHPSNRCSKVSSIEGRKAILRRDGRCYICLKRNHKSFECQEKKCPVCQNRHHISICQVKENSTQGYSRNQGSHQSSQNQQRNQTRYQNPNQQSQSNSQVSRFSSNSQTNFGQTSLAMYVNSSTPILLPTARTTVFNPAIFGTSLQARIVFDCGSQKTYITREVRERLKLRTVHRSTCLIKTFGAANEVPQTFDVVRVHLQTVNGDVSMLAIVVPRICDSLSGQILSKAQRQFPDLHFADYSDGMDVSIEILIGSDEYWNFVTGDVIRGESGSTAMNTCFGWVLIGPFYGSRYDKENGYPEMVSTNFISSSESNQALQDSLQRFWDLESLGIESRSLYDQHVEKIKFKDGRYEVELPWKPSHPKLPDNFELCLQRLNGLMRKLRRSPELLEEYQKVMKDQLEQNIVEKVEDPNQGKVGKVHYIPHHPVIRRDKTTTKLRIVYDASAKQRPSYPSLNDCLFSGPPLTENILDIILRFRVHRIALAGDIEKAFLMVSMAQQERDVLRFLWYENPEAENSQISVYRFTRVTFGVSSSPFLLNATVKHHIEQYAETNPELVRNILRSIYVDDLSTGANNVEEAYQLYEESKSKFATGGFNLRKFVTNSSELRDKIKSNELNIKPTESGSPTTAENALQEEDESYTKFIFGHSTSAEHQKILGVKWNFVQDQIVIDWSEVFEEAKDIVPTKRLVVSVSSRFYDPLGFLSPFIVQFKLLFQDLCKNNLEWDEPLSGELLSKWRNLINSANRMQPIYVNRCYFNNMEEKIITCQLHGFCDASAKAYGAVVYLKIVTTTSSYVKFLSSKTRIAPINSQTIPRLELLSALILARLVSTIKKALEYELQIDGIHCWTDSKVAYFWISQEDKEWKQFIQNRVDEIRNLVPANSFNHCPGLENPADIPSRGMNPLELTNNSLWINGPEWLIHLEESNLEPVVENDLPKECLVEMKVKNRETYLNCQSDSVMLVTLEDNGISNIINCQNYGNLHRLLRVTANVLRFIVILKSRVSHEVKVKESFYEYVNEAETIWVQDVQRQLVKRENFKSIKRQLDVYEDPQKLLRCKGRLGNSQFPVNTRFPILLDSTHHFTSLVVINCHRKVMHNGVKETLTELRSKYWIIRGRQYVRKLIHQCITCRKYEDHHYQPPKTPHLPDFRVQPSDPFNFIGVDFAGPLYVKNGTTDVQKVWLCLFTCCVTRGVHLEIVPNMLTSSFLRCFQRFTARRGYPARVVSDNGKTFKSAAKILQDKLVWSFNIEKASWWGGIFERMIQSAKRCLKKTIGGSRLSYDELVTLIVNIESVLNSRPISYVSTEDVEEPLTPSHLIYGRRILDSPENSVPEFEFQNVSQEALSNRVRYMNQVMDHFWRRWSSEYLLELRNRYASKIKSGPVISNGDVVIIHHENLPRCRWKIGRVTELIQGADKEIRAVKLRVQSENGKIITIQRPVQKLYPLEMSMSNHNESILEESVNTSNGELESRLKNSCPQLPNPSSSNQRPRRVAAQESDRKRKDWIKQLMS